MDAAPQSSWTGHQLLLAGPRRHLTFVAAGIDRGLRRGGTVLYAANAQIPDLEALISALVSSGLEVARAAEAGQLLVVDPDRFYSVTAYEALVVEAMRQGRRGVLSVGSPQSAAAVLGADEFDEFEQLLDRLSGSHGAAAVCWYDPAAIDGRGEWLDQAVQRHASGWREASLHAYWTEPGRLHISGDVDASNEAVFGLVLAKAAQCCGDRLVLDCTDLRFTSVNAWRVAQLATAPVWQRGGRVALTGLAPIADRVLRLTGFARAFDREQIDEC